MSDRYHVEHDAAGWHVYDTAPGPLLPRLVEREDTVHG